MSYRQRCEARHWATLQRLQRKTRRLQHGLDRMAVASLDVARAFEENTVAIGLLIEAFETWSQHMPMRKTRGIRGTQDR